MESKDNDESNVFDYWRIREEEIFVNLKRVLGPAYSLIHEVLELHKLLFELAQKPILDLEDPNQIAASFHLLAWMRHEALAGALMLMRGHITDSSNFSRRALEICAFTVVMFSNKESAKRWMEVGASNKAIKRYKDSFPAWKVVQEQLPKELVDFYETQCFDVHPSFLAATKRARLTDDFKHVFAYSDLSETDSYQTFFVMSFLNLCSYHGKMMVHLASVFSASENFDISRWNSAYNDFEQKWRAECDRRKPIFDAHFAEHDNQNSKARNRSEKKNTGDETT